MRAAAPVFLFVLMACGGPQAVVEPPAVAEVAEPPPAVTVAAAPFVFQQYTGVFEQGDEMADDGSFVDYYQFSTSAGAAVEIDLASSQVGVLMRLKQVTSWLPKSLRPAARHVYPCRLPQAATTWLSHRPWSQPKSPGMS